MRILLLGTFLCSAIAHAESAPPRVVVDTNGQAYSAYAHDAGSMVIATPQPATLVRDEHTGAPPCSDINASLNALARRIDDCKNTRDSRCDDVRNEVQRIRATDNGTLEQRWFQRPTPAPSVPSYMLSRIADQLGLRNDQVVTPALVTPSSDPSNVHTTTTAGGASWASRLLGFIDFNAAPIEYNPSFGAFVTRDQILACGLLSQDVAFTWDQPALLTFAPNENGPITSTALWGVYLTLKEDPPAGWANGIDGRTWETLYLGARIGIALLHNGLAERDLAARLRFVIERLFDSRLQLRTDLTERNTVLIKSSITVSMPMRANARQ